MLDAAIAAAGEALIVGVTNEGDVGVGLSECGEGLDLCGGGGVIDDDDMRVQTLPSEQALHAGQGVLSGVPVEDDDGYSAGGLYWG